MKDITYLRIENKKELLYKGFTYGVKGTQGIIDRIYNKYLIDVLIKDEDSYLFWGRNFISLKQ